MIRILRNDKIITDLKYIPTNIFETDEFVTIPNYHFLWICDIVTVDTISHIQNLILDIRNKLDTIIIDNGSEAISHYSMYLLHNFFTLNNIKYLILQSGLDSTLNGISSIFAPLFFRHIEIENISIVQRDKLFTCLNRLMVGREHRVVFVHELFKRNLLKLGTVSCGSGDTDIKPIKRIFSQSMSLNFVNLLPIYLDGFATRQNGDKILDISKSSIFNVVLETSFSNNVSKIHNQISYNGGHGWTRPFLTEKTTKAINIKQLPLFLSSCGYVQKLREFGFDVFDDIINHTYDTFDDPDLRIIMLADEVERLSKIPRNKLNEILIKNKIDYRLQENVTMLKKLETSMHLNYHKKLNTWMVNCKLK